MEHRHLLSRERSEEHRAGGLQRHDNRYEVAEEYVEVLYKLFEGSWEDDAVVRDRSRRIFAHPEKVHEIGHKGRYFDVPGYHPCEPSPQRTPVLYQAGASGPGKSFAARNAECVFVGAQSKRLLKAYVGDVREKAAAAGRDPRKLFIYNLVTIIVDETDAKAKAKFEDYQRYASYDGAFVFMSGWSGIDFGRFDPSNVIKKEETNAVHSLVEHLTGGDRTWTVKELALWGGIGGVGPVFVGSAPTIADLLQEWVEETERRWIQPCLCGDARDVRGHRQSSRAGAAAAWRLSDRLQPWDDAARETFLSRPASSCEPSGRSISGH